MCKREESDVWQDWDKSVTVTQMCGFVCRVTAGVRFYDSVNVSCGMRQVSGVSL